MFQRLQLVYADCLFRLKKYRYILSRNSIGKRKKKLFIYYNHFILIILYHLQKENLKTPLLISLIALNNPFSIFYLHSFIITKNNLLYIIHIHNESRRVQLLLKTPLLEFILFIHLLLFHIIYIISSPKRKSQDSIANKPNSSKQPF